MLKQKLLVFFVLLAGLSILSDLYGHVYSSDADYSSKSDTSLVNRLNRLALDYYRTNPDTAFKLAKQALNLSLDINYTKGIAGAYIALAYTHLLSFSKNDSAHQYFRKAYNIYYKINDSKGLALVCYGFGYVYSFRGDMAESEKYMLKALEYSKKAGFKRGIFNSCSALSYIHKQYKDLEKAYDYIDTAIAVASETNNFSGLADLFNSKGNLFKDQALFEQAIDTYFKALQLWEQAGDSSGIAIAYGSLANVYYYQNDNKKALEYYYKKLPISLRSKENWEVSKTYAGIASAYDHEHRYDSALHYLHKSLELNRMMNLPSGIADVYYKLANTYDHLEFYDSASVYLNRAVVIARNLNDKARLAEYYVLHGKLLDKMGNRRQALESIENGYKIAKELSILFVLSDATGLLNTLYAEEGNFKKAYQNLLEHKAIQDSIQKDQNIKRITQLEMQYEFDKKQRQIDYETQQERLTHAAALRQQRLFLYGVIGLFLLIVLIGILFFRQRTLHAKFQTMELEQKLLLTQMNPHFIFNSLSAIQNFIIENNAKEANRFLSRFSMLMRHILENSRAEFISIADEVDTLQHYLEIQQLRFGKPFDYALHVDDVIDTETFAIPPMLAQPFIENAIEHGLIPKKEKGKIDIDFKLMEKNIIKLTIQDNGVGIKKAVENKNINAKDRNSLATLLTIERLKHLKQKYKGNIFLKVTDLSEEAKSTGTRVILQIPYQRIYS